MQKPNDIVILFLSADFLCSLYNFLWINLLVIILYNSTIKRRFKYRKTVNNFHKLGKIEP